jgi:hypothetical protein
MESDGIWDHIILAYYNIYYSVEIYLVALAIVVCSRAIAIHPSAGPR